MSKKTSFFLTFFPFVLQNHHGMSTKKSREKNVGGENEKTRKKSKKVKKLNIFSVFSLFFRNHLGILRTLKKRNHPGLSLFLRFFTFFIDFFFSIYWGDFAKKTKKRSEKMKLFCLSRGSSPKKQVSVIYEKIYMPLRK